MSLCCSITKRKVQQLECKLKNFKTYPNGIGVRQLGTTSLPIETIVMASEVVYRDDLIFKDANGTQVLKLTTNGGIFNGNVTGDITGNVNGNLIGDVTGDVIGNVTGDLTGNVTGNVTGNLFGNVTGSLFAQLSSNVVRLPNMSNTSFGSATTGSIVIDTTVGELKFFNGSIWKTITST